MLRIYLLIAHFSHAVKGWSSGALVSVHRRSLAPGEGPTRVVLNTPGKPRAGGASGHALHPNQIGKKGDLRSLADHKVRTRPEAVFSAWGWVGEGGRVSLGGPCRKGGAHS
jgi:hypothetical protein